MADDPAQARELPRARSPASIPTRVARFGERDVERLLGDAGIVRHRGKIEAAIANARGVLALREAGTPLHELVWSYAPADYAAPRTTADWHAQTPESTELSKRLKAAGFRFVGPTTVYAAMQACGVVNDHLADVLGARRGRAAQERANAARTVRLGLALTVQASDLPLHAPAQPRKCQCFAATARSVVVRS